MFFKKIKMKLNAKLLLINAVGIILMSAILTVFSVLMIREAFNGRYEEKLQTPGRIFLAQYTSADILPYIDKLKSLENIKGTSEDFLKDRLYIFDTEASVTDGNYPNDYYKAQESVNVYAKSFAQLKDDEYYSIVNAMLNLKLGAGLRSFYIFADLGVGDFYTHIFDANFQGGAASMDSGDFGAPVPKSYLPKAESVFKTGKPVLELNSSGSGSHAMSTYALMPVADYSGNVVAVICTDINMLSIERQFDYFLIFDIAVIAGAAFLLLCVMLFALRRLVVKPVRALTSLSGEIADGDIYGEIPVWIKNRTDEMGGLGKSFESMSVVLQEVLAKNNALFEAAMSGKLDARSSPDSLRGLFAQVVGKINDTLDVIGAYFDSIPGALAILDSEYEIVFVNNHFKKLFTGVTAETIYGKLLEGGDSESYDSLKEKLAQTLEKGEYSAHVWFGDACLSFTCSPVLRDGNNNGAIFVITDSTELVLAKDRALSANKAKSEFLSRVSHELRTPLNVILSMSKLGLNDTSLGDSKERHRKIAAASGHLSDIINDVLDMSRMEAGKIEIRRAPMKLRETIKKCADLLILRAEEKNLTINWSTDDAIPENLIGDEFRIRQILINLLNNAVKFTITGGVTINAALIKRDGGELTVMFSVTDTGIGMSEEFLSKVFEPFEQEDSFLNRRYEGSGLGLSICYNLVNLMGGETKVTSEPGKGSSFTFTIPFETAYEAAEDENRDETVHARVSLAGKTVLLADDIDINRSIMREILADTGLHIDEAADGEAAYNAYVNSPEGHYSCILMDVQMPKMDGYETTRKIRACGRVDCDIPIIAMTANALKEDVDRALQSGMTDHIAKPVDFDDCLNKVNKYCLR